MRDDFLRGGAILLVSTVFFSLSDTMAKYVTAEVAPVQLAFVRYGVFVLLALVPFMRRNPPSMRSRRPGLQVVRGLGVVVSAVAFIMSLGSLPIAEATAINFVTPLIITVLAVPVLGEVVRPQGWAAVLVGFVGVLIVVRPGVGGFHPAALLVLLSSMAWSVAILSTRRLVAFDPSGVTVLWTAVTGFVAIALALPLVYRPMTWEQLGLCLTIGVVASIGQWGAVIAYRYARATALAPLTYSQLIWSSMLGYLVFHNTPDWPVYVGAAIIAASGLYVVQMERRRIL